MKFFVLCTGTGFNVHCASDIRGIHHGSASEFGVGR